LSGRGRIGQIGNGERRAAGKLFDNCLASLLVATVNYDPCAFRKGPAGNRLADAGRAASDDDYFFL
jgi:hypothetical protein